MSEGIYEIALRYYKSGNWNKAMIDALYEKKKITLREYKKIIAEKDNE